ncbi:MAG: hypothetical protein K2N03_09025 [Muribaculaceae bacterium]|nr:hypothetical protein [Muribaculaceae bacterium]
MKRKFLIISLSILLAALTADGQSNGEETSGKADGGITLWADGKEQSGGEYYIDASRGSSEMSRLTFYIRGSVAFEEYFREGGDIASLRCSITPDFDVTLMGDRYYPPYPLSVEYDYSEEILELTSEFIPIPGVYTLRVQFEGTENLEKGDASLKVVARPNILNVIPTFTTMEWDGPTLPYINGGAYYVQLQLNSDPVDSEGNHLTPTPLVLGSYYGFRKPYLKIYDSLSGIMQKGRSIDPELKEYVGPIPFDVVDSASSIRMEFWMNGAESVRPETIIMYKDVVTALRGIDGEEEIAEYYNLIGERVFGILSPGIYVKKKGRESSTILVR